MVRRHRVAALSELPDGEGRQVEIDGKAVALFRRGGTVCAVADACPHMGAPLSDGYVDGKQVVCPWHGWAFDLETGASPFDDEACIDVYGVRIEGDEVFVEIDDEAAQDPEPRTGTDADP